MKHLTLWISLLLASLAKAHQIPLSTSHDFTDEELHDWIPWIDEDDETHDLEPIELTELDNEDSRDFQTYSMQFLTSQKWKICELTSSIQQNHHRITTDVVMEKRRASTMEGWNWNSTRLFSREDVINHWHVPHLRDKDDEIITLYGPTMESLELTSMEYCETWIKPISEDYFAPYQITSLKESTIQLQQIHANTLKEKDKIFKFVHTGSPGNRIDVVFLSDGYTAKERRKFVKDVKRLVRKMWIGPTFRSVLPLFNVWGVFRPSHDHGIGTNGHPKDTAFGLYREGSELRGIFCSKPRQARQACRQIGPKACDYPGLLANDNLYGGLGGEFITTTRSKHSGSVVFRHEFGHVVVSEGEEYDGGYVYSGPNAAPSLQQLGWQAWLTVQGREEKSHLAIQEYPWTTLDYGPYTLNFESNGGYKRWLLRFSISGAPSDDALKVYLDGQKLSWKSCGHEDRCFYDIMEDHFGFERGKHELTFVSNKDYSGAKSKLPIQLCSVNLNEYGDEDEFKFSNFISAYPTWDINKRKSYRPTNEYCLMRNMMSNRFCPVCQEGMWLNLLKRINMVDKIKVQCHGDEVEVKMKLIGKASHYRIRWFQGQNQEVNELEDKTSWKRSAQNSQGDWQVRVDWSSHQVRHDPKDLSHFERRFYIQC